MLTYHERLELAVARYKAIQKMNRRLAWGPIETGPPNIPNTAEVITIMRCVDEEYDSQSVQHGLNYLATRVFIHPRDPKEEGGRGPLTRWLTYGLMGLTQWEDWRDDETPRKSSRIPDVTVIKAVEHCLTWLRDNHRSHGWPDRIGDRKVSLLATATAIVALDRIGELQDEVLLARNHLTTFVRKDGSWPAALVQPASTAPASAPHTALAVLALMEGNEAHRDAAKRGSKWLLEHASAWGTVTDREEKSAFEPWWHMTFSLGLRACLSAHVDPLAPELAPTIDLLDRLWVGDGPEAHQWRGGDGAQASVHGSHSVVLAYEHLRREQRQIDPITLFEMIRTNEAAAQEVRNYFEFEFDDDARLLLIVDTRTGQGVDPIRLGMVGWNVVKRVAELQYSCDPPRTSIALDELDGISDDIKALIRRINNTVKRDTGMRLKKLLMTPNGTNTCMLAIRPKSAVSPPSSASS